MSERVTFRFDLQSSSNDPRSTGQIETDFSHVSVKDCRMALNPHGIDEPRLLAELSFEFDPTAPDDEVRSATGSVLERLLTSLALRADIFVERVESEDDLKETRSRWEFNTRLNPQEGEMAAIRGCARLEAKAQVLRPLPERLRVNLKDELSQVRSEPLLLAYWIAGASHDPVGEFLLYYAILATIYGERQRDIDKALDPKRSGRSAHPRSSDGETVYTRVRNELAHPKSRGRPLAEAVAEAGGVAT
ncbi:MAG TPA: hypothetical protein VFJ58_16060 [Armatimonadota bacterium]|nr:hypothetical protein [Armatimonadota bacterium]